MTKVEDLDRIILSEIDIDTFNKVILINTHVNKILDDQNFWKLRIEKRLGLYSQDPDIDYKFISKVLDERLFDGLTFTNLYYTVKDNKKYSQLTNLLEENKVIKPPELLSALLIDGRYLLNKNKSTYDNFINTIIDDSDKLEYFNELVYKGKELFVFTDTGETLTLKSDNGFTNGLILYELAKNLPKNVFRNLLHGEHIYFNGLSYNYGSDRYEILDFMKPPK